MRRERAPLRAGYMGHLTEIANSLQAVAARRPAVARTLCSNAAWTDFAFGPLAERNQVPPQPVAVVLHTHASDLLLRAHLLLLCTLHALSKCHHALEVCKAAQESSDACTHLEKDEGLLQKVLNIICC